MMNSGRFSMNKATVSPRDMPREVAQLATLFCGYVCIKNYNGKAAKQLGSMTCDIRKVNFGIKIARIPTEAVSTWL